MLRDKKTDIEVEAGPVPVHVKASVQRANIWGILFVVAFFSFILGNRWSSILDSVGGNDPKTEQVAELPNDLDLSEVEAVYDVLRREFDGQLTEQQLIDGIKEGLARAAADPYTVYLNADASKQFTDDLNGTFTGIGAELGLDDNQRLIVVAPLDGFPAQTAGVRAQDIIASIDGEDTFDYTIEAAVSKIRGPEGSDVVLGLIRSNQLIEITITRQEIVVPSVKSEILEGNIGYLQLTRFAEDTVRLAEAAAADFKAKGVNGVILDLRNNSGGFLDAAVNITGMWVDGQAVVDQRRGDQTISELSAESGAILGGIPTVILINEGSASASEIVAGAMQDYGLATLVGQQSFGKGSVQSLERIPGEEGVLKVTIARWFTPNGNNIDQDGITPEEMVEMTEEDYAEERDPQQDRALEILNTKP